MIKADFIQKQPGAWISVLLEKRQHVFEKLILTESKFASTSTEANLATTVSIYDMYKEKLKEDESQYLKQVGENR
jgi:hypothetical protein